MKLVSFSNQRPVSEQGSFLTASQTEGKLRITRTVGDMLGVVEGDYVAIGGDPSTNKLFVYKGVKTDKVQVGNKLTKAGQTFEFGSKNAWDEVGGNTDHPVRYTVSETPIEYGEGEDMMLLYELTDKEDMKRVERKSKGEGGEEEEGTEETTETVTEEAPSVEAEDEGFSLD